ncbi:NERD domain-containing protein [Kocuria sp. LUK]|uniref:nuclease-related domain-containing protein n=1 Tax=Kocuria sp. LUK TaxID=2897828 RepID=UPI001E3F3FE0|nr:nuclease-related domain-containing protein [Kocuria sp. LUK]MCD1144550.1 NERD domain-containing protein [Kocuria sp. LUK]
MTLHSPTAPRHPGPESSARPTAGTAVPPVAFPDDSSPPFIRSLGFAAFRLLRPMPEPATEPPLRPLTDRCAAQAVMAEALSVQEGVPPRSWWGRLTGADPLSAESRPWVRGAEGELWVGELLDRLGPEWTVLHSVPVGVGASDIDHVLVGPAGVFTLNTKHHAGQDVWLGEHLLMVAGQRTHHLRHARHEAARAAKRLGAAVGEPVHVTPVIVLVAPKELTVRQRPADVQVLTDQRLLRWLRRRRAVLTADQVARLEAAAARPETWHDAPGPAEDPVTLRERFTALQESVRAARLRRALWRFGGPAAAAVLFFGSEPVRAVLSGL